MSGGFVLASLISTVVVFKDLSAKRRRLFVSLGVAMVLLGLPQLLMALRMRGSAP
jgi:hypothetical protein